MAQGKGTAGAVAEAPADGATGEAANGTTAEAKTNSRPNRSYIVVPVPADLKTRFEEEAKAADVPVGPYVRNLLAKFLGIEIPVSASTRRSKYASDEERKAAQTTRNQTRSATMRNLMAAFRDMQAKGISPEEAARLASAQVITAAGGTAPAAETPQPEAVPA